MHKGKLSGVLHKGFRPDKCKISLKMAMARIKLLRNKKEVQVRQMRREVAQLLEGNNDTTARIRVEHVIREEKFMQAYELIEVYCELIVARMSIIDSQKTCPIDLKEAIASVIFASMRCSDVTELVDVRKNFTSKYGKDFAAAALEVRPDSGVNRLVIEKLSAGAPDVQTKTKTLSSIAAEHNIKWEPKAFEEKLQKQDEGLQYGSATYSGGNIPTAGSSAYSMPTPQPAAPSYSSVESATPHMPTIPSYASPEVQANKNPYGTADSNSFSQENRRGSDAPVPSSQHGATTYSSAHVPGSNNLSHENTGDSSVSRPYAPYGVTVPEITSRDEEISRHRERKSTASGSNWNMEFKDATSAAQAAAESAEMASIAARAAAQLASRGNFSAERNTGTYESAAYMHETTPRKQQAEHSMKDYKRTSIEQDSGINDPRMIPRNARKDAERAETSRVSSQNISTPHSSAQFHSYGHESHPDVYGMPTVSPHAHSPEPSYFGDSSEKETYIGRPDDHPFDVPGDRSPNAGLGRHSTKEDLFDQDRTNNYDNNFSSSHRGSSTYIGRPDDHPFDLPGDRSPNARLGGHSTKEDSFDQDRTNNYNNNFSSSHGGSSTIWDSQNDNTGADSSAFVFDKYDYDVEEETFLDPFSRKHAEELPTGQDHTGFSSADWSQQPRSESPVDHGPFLRTETQPSYDLEADRKDTPSPHSYSGVLPPTFDSDGASSDEEITTGMHVDSLRSNSRGSDFSENRSVNRTSGKLIPDVNDSLEQFESRSREQYQNPPGFNMSYKEQHSDPSPRSYHPGSQGQMGRVPSREYDLSDGETEQPKLKGSSSEITGANKNQPLSLNMQTSATYDDNDEGDIGLNFGRLTPGLRNKLRQPPPYKNSGENMLPKEPLQKAPDNVEESVPSKETETSFRESENTPKSSRTPKSSFGASYHSELNDAKRSVGKPVESRSSMTRNYYDSTDTVKLSEQSGTTNSTTPKSSGSANSSQELRHERTGIGARRESRSRNAKTYFDSDDSEEELERQRGEEELERQLAVQTKLSREQIQSRRTREVTSDTKRDGRVRTGAKYADETESTPKETKTPAEAFPNSSTVQRREAPAYSRVSVQRPSPNPVRIETPTARGKWHEDELDGSSSPDNEGNTGTSTETPKDNTSATAPKHVHPKLPTDYDSFAAHFKSLRTNRR